jgi:hypothetical protein
MGGEEVHTFALQMPSMTLLPAQLRTSWAKRMGSESSWRALVRLGTK